jgi:hypothetical protein
VPLSVSRSSPTVRCGCSLSGASIFHTARCISVFFLCIGLISTPYCDFMYLSSAKTFTKIAMLQGNMITISSEITFGLKVDERMLQCLSYPSQVIWLMILA